MNDHEVIRVRLAEQILNLAIRMRQITGAPSAAADPLE
jgi:hypothetical protein